MNPFVALTVEVVRVVMAVTALTLVPITRSLFSLVASIDLANVFIVSFAARPMPLDADFEP